MSVTSLAEYVTGTSPRPLVIDLYCRLSTDNDGTTHTVDEQEARGRTQVEALGHVVGMVHKDHAKSAWNPKVIRDEWLVLMARLRNGEADGMWVRDLDRYTRKPREGEDLLELAAGGTLVLSKHGEHDLTSARGKHRFREDMNDGAYESDRISERTRDGLHAKAERGEVSPSLRGFARDGYLPREHKADLRVRVPEAQLEAERAAVRDLVDGLLADTTTLGATAREWNAKGLRTAKGGLWDAANLHQMLKAPSLAGLIRSRGMYVGTMPGEPAVDRATWDRLMLKFKSRGRGRTATTYVLSGVLRCGLCDSPLYGRPVVKQTPYPDGAQRRQYWCQKRPKGGGCGRLTIDWRFADAVVEQMVVERLEDPQNAEQMARHSARVTEAAEVIRAEVLALETEKVALGKKVGTGGWTMAMVDRGVANYQALIDEAEARLRTLGTPGSPVPPEQVRERWAKANVQGRRALVAKAFPNGITVQPTAKRGGVNGKAALDPERLQPR